eukprot:SAG31_NODE_4016_length_3662_cov_3.395453_4_plen_107_part_00
MDAEFGGLLQPTIFKRQQTHLVDPDELWFFDTRGYLIIKNVMDPVWLRQCNEAFDIFASDPARVPLVPEAVLRTNGHVWPEGTSELLKGTPAVGLKIHISADFQNS